MEKNLEDLGTTQKSFFMWLVAHNRCWTADRLVRWGLPAVLFLTRQPKPLIISSLVVSSQESSGSISCHKLACNPISRWKMST